MSTEFCEISTNAEGKVINRFAPSDTPEKTEYFNKDVLDKKSLKQEINEIHKY